MIFERITQSSSLELVVNIMMMLCLFLSLFASQLFLVTSFAIKTEQVESIEEPLSLEVNTTTSESPNLETAEAPWVYGISTQENTEHEDDTCQRVGLYVNFTEVGLSEIIVAPAGFKAYQCKGKCSLTERKKFPNRSPLMALLGEKKGIKTAGESCCVPTKLGSISLLFMDKNEKVVLRNIDDVVVEECGCQ